jgi:hypothetical protein
MSQAEPARKPLMSQSSHPSEPQSSTIPGVRTSVVAHEPNTQPSSPTLRHEHNRTRPQTHGQTLHGTTVWVHDSISERSRPSPAGTRQVATHECDLPGTEAPSERPDGRGTCASRRRSWVLDSLASLDPSLLSPFFLRIFCQLSNWCSAWAKRAGSSFFPSRAELAFELVRDNESSRAEPAQYPALHVLKCTRQCTTSAWKE